MTTTRRRSTAEPVRARARAARKTPSESARTLASLRRHIDAELAGDLRLPTLARRAGMSTSRFSHWFREQMGIAPHAYVLEARLARARELLQGGERSLLEIALEVGFASQSCLHVSFRRRIGMTPSEYRTRYSRKAKDAPRAGVR